MKTINKIFKVSAAVAVVAMLGACATGQGSNMNSGNTAYSATASTQTYAPPSKREVTFPNPDRAWLKKGAFIDVEQLRRMGRGLSKNQVRELISYPHFEEGFFGVSTWDYIFNLRTGKADEYITCQYQVQFTSDSDEKSNKPFSQNGQNGKEDASGLTTDGMYWNKPACADLLAPRVAEVLRPIAPVAIAPAVVPAERVKLGADALFGFDKSGRDDMLPEGRAQLDKLVSDLNARYKRVDSVTVIGHTDRLGTDAHNYPLSVARAATVRDYLVSRGLPTKSVKAFGVGRTEPVAQCADSMARQELIACLKPNRRVEVEIWGERG